MLVVIALCFFVPTAPALADDTPDPESERTSRPFPENPDGPIGTEEAAMRDAMHTYFEGEKDGGISFMTVGALGLAAGGVLVAFDEPEVLRPAAYPMLGIGALQLAVGIIVYTRTDAQVAELDAQLESDPSAFAEAERARMAGVETSFIWLEVIEGVLIAGGLTTAVIGFVEDIPFAQGFGLSLAGEAAATLALDIWAAVRAADYVDALEGFQAGLAAGPDGGASVVLRWRF